MINVDREANIPTSLASAEIQEYIDAIEDHLIDPTANPKPKIAPEYRNSDIFPAFDRIFFQKCYLTEQKFPNSWCMDIEHFVGRSDDATLAYTWTNLYPAEHRANNMKPRNNPPGGYLDPCDQNDNVENEILYSVGIYAQCPTFKPLDPNNVKAVNTCNLLERLHNGHNEETINSTAELRLQIFKKHYHIIELIMQWQGQPDPVLRHQYEMQLKFHLSRKESFTMLMRSMIPVRQHLPAHFFD